MLKIRRSCERGHFNHGWLDTYHTFSFGDYFAADFMGFRVLRVINEDTVQPAKGFGTHPHKNMEILTYVLEGSLEHKDSLGNGSVIRPHEMQRMTAGTGVTHSEFNHSESELVHFLQIWIFPEKENLEPGYQQKLFPAEEKKNRLKLIASQGGQDGSIHLNQDVKVYASILDSGHSLNYPLQPNHFAWVQIARGSLLLNGTPLEEGDGAAIASEPALNLQALTPVEFLLFELP